jgi:hypothetical protein
LNFSIEDILRFSCLLPIFLFLRLSKEEKKEKWVILLFPLSSFIHSFIYAVLLIYSTANIAFIFNSFYIPIEFITISLYFFKAISYDIHKKSLWVVVTFFALIFGFETYLNPNEQFDSLTNITESTFFIFYALVFFYENIKYPKNLFIYRQPFFWGSAAFFIFYSTTFFAFLYRQTSWASKDFIYQYLYIHAVAGIIRNLLLAVGVMVKPEKVSLSELT